MRVDGELVAGLAGTGQDGTLFDLVVAQHVVVRHLDEVGGVAVDLGLTDPTDARSARVRQVHPLVLAGLEEVLVFCDLDRLVLLEELDLEPARIAAVVVIVVVIVVIAVARSGVGLVEEADTARQRDGPGTADRAEDSTSIDVGEIPRHGRRSVLPLGLRSSVRLLRIGVEIRISVRGHRDRGFVSADIPVGFNFTVLYICVTTQQF